MPQGYAPPTQGYAPPPQGYAPPPQYQDQQYQAPPYPPQEQAYQQYPPPPDQFQPPQQYQQPQGYAESNRGGYGNGFQPMDNFQQSQPPSYPAQQQYQPPALPQYQPQPPQQQFQQFQDDNPRYSANPPMPRMPAPPQPPTDFADAARARQQAYAPVQAEEDAPEAPQSPYRPPSQPPQPSFQQPPPLPQAPQDQRSDWNYPPPPQQEQQWQQPPPQPQYNAPQGYQPQANAGAPMGQRPYQRAQHNRFNDRRHDDHQYKPHRPPPPSYVCHNCRQPGHWKQQCPLFENEGGRFNGSRQDHQFQQQRYGPGPAQSQQWGAAPPLPGAKPQDPRRNGEAFHPEGAENAGFAMNPEPHNAPPLPEGPAPPLPPNSPPLPYAPQQQQPQPGGQVWKCDACVKSFVIESQYAAHMKSHVNCSDCEFAASKRLVTAHWETTHGQYAGQGLKEIDIEGQKFTVLVGNSAEDIAKWREERRKKWLLMSSQPKPKPAPTGTATKRKLSVSSEEDLEEGEIEEDEEAKGQLALQKAMAAPVSSQEPPAKRPRKMLCKWFLRGHCRFDEAHCKYSHDTSAFGCRAMMQRGSCSKGMECLFSHDTAVLAVQRERKQTASKQRATEQQWRGEQKSLLRKLLAKDVRVEQHKMLQLVHFLVTNKFLDGEAAEVSAKTKIEVLGSEGAVTAEASEPIDSVSEDTVMEEASSEVKPAQASTEEADSAASSQAAQPIKAEAEGSIVPAVEATACEQEAQPVVEQSEAAVPSVEANEESDTEPANPEAVAEPVASKEMEAAPDSSVGPAVEVAVATSGQADTAETSASEAMEA